jgi:hypothetical protein
MIELNCTYSTIFELQKNKSYGNQFIGLFNIIIDPKE